MKRISFLLLMSLFFSTAVLSQDSTAIDLYNRSNRKIQKSMHISLGSWALANFAGSAIMLNATDARVDKYFYQMNIYWNVINAAIAGIALGHLHKKDFSNQDLVVLKKDQRKLERLMLTNMGLDVLYIGSGLLMNSYSDRYKKNPELMEGFGKSIAFQGAFLLLFDTTFYSLYRKNGKKILPGVNFSLAPGAIRIQTLF